MGHTGSGETIILAYSNLRVSNPAILGLFGIGGFFAIIIGGLKI